MKELINDFFNKYSYYIIGGVIGAVIHRIQNKMSFLEFIGAVITSSFVGFCTGILLSNYLKAPQEVVFVGCSLAGVFSKHLLAEILSIIKMTSELVRKKVNLKEDSEETKEDL